MLRAGWRPGAAWVYSLAAAKGKPGPSIGRRERAAAPSCVVWMCMSCSLVDLPLNLPPKVDGLSRISVQECMRENNSFEVHPFHAMPCVSWRPRPRPTCRFHRFFYRASEVPETSSKREAGDTVTHNIITLRNWLRRRTYVTTVYSSVREIDIHTRANGAVHTYALNSAY